MDTALFDHGSRGVACLVARSRAGKTQGATDVLVSAWAESAVVDTVFWFAADRVCPGRDCISAGRDSDHDASVLAHRPLGGYVDAALYCLGHICHDIECLALATEFILSSSEQSGIHLERVSKSFDEAGQRRIILDQLSLDAEGGEFIAVRGPSGSGKSTLLNILGGIDLSDSGSVHVGGQDITHLGETARTLYRRHHVGFVFQFFNLVPTLTVADNLRLPLELCKKYRNETEIINWLERFDLADRANAYPDVLSGGEQQRIAIIRAAIHRPLLILADEPTGNLDAVTGDSVLELLREVVEQGTCVIMATHSREAADASDRRLVLKQGRLHSESVL